MTRIENLVDRLRGIYVLAIDDGLGPLDGKMVHETRYDTTPLKSEAAHAIEIIEEGETYDGVEDLIKRLMTPCDPLDTGREYVIPIHREAAQHLNALIKKGGG